MLTIAAAFEHILQTVTPLEATSVPLEEALGLVLANDVAADSDSPPFDKSMMDGYDVRSADLIAGTARFAVTDLIAAGQFSTKAVGSGEAIQIMTGAPLPAGADVVVKVEECQRDAE